MGLDLTLLPMRDSNDFSHEVLRVTDWDKLEAIQSLRQMEIDDGFNSYVSRDDAYEDTHYGETIETPYGERLMWVLAKDLKTVGLTGPVGAFIEAMNDRDRVALFWC
ncbi:MAG: hypothetical protein GY750_11305 [Lentisphaerae bacterium]|nr:hypothetical protein [Lentisphaerota bacterium]